MASNDSQAQLAAIQTQVTAIEERLHERLPRQQRQLAAMVCAWKWRLQTLAATDKLTLQLCEQTRKRMRQEVGAFDYQAREQGELLTRHLCELDNILSYGDAEIKAARKALVVSIQSILTEADTRKALAARLKDFTERLIERLPTVTAGSDEDQPPHEPQETEQENVDTDVDMTPERVQTGEGKPGDVDMPSQEDEAEDKVGSALFEEEDDEEEGKQDTGEVIQNSKLQEDAAPVDREGDTQMDECEDEEDKEEDEDEEEESDDDDIAEQQLPVWRPYYEVKKCGDGVYLVMNLGGVDPNHVRIQTTSMPGDFSLLTISGVKYPSQRDLMLTRLTGKPTFGRFQVSQRLPLETMNVDSATQRFLSDGTLQIRVPYRMAVRRLPMQRRFGSPFMPAGLTVW